MPSSEPLTVGLVGCGNMTRVVHLPLILATGAFQVVAICDPRPEQLAAAAALVPDARTYTDCGALAKHESVDALVVVVAPQDLAAAIERSVRCAARAVFVEKPLGFDYEDARRIASSIPPQLVTWCGFNRRHWPALEAVRQLIAQNGPLQHLEIALHKWVGDREHWWTPDQPLVYSEMCHAFDLLVELGGAPTRCNLTARTQHDRFDLVAGTGSFASGATWSLVCNFSSGDQLALLTAHTIGMRALLRNADELIVAYGNDRVETMRAWDGLSQWWREGYADQWRAFAAAVRSADPASRGFSRELITMELCAAAVASAAAPSAA